MSPPSIDPHIASMQRVRERIAFGPGERSIAQGGAVRRDRNCP
jgi:hypothetical protein